MLGCGSMVEGSPWEGFPEVRMLGRGLGEGVGPWPSEEEERVEGTAYFLACSEITGFS